MDDLSDAKDQTTEDVFDDSRLFERFSARFPVRFKDSRDDYGTTVFLRDASAEGVRLSTKERLYLHDSVSLEVELPDRRYPFPVKGQVIWSKNVAPDVWDVGIKVHKVDLVHMERLYRFCVPQF